MTDELNSAESQPRFKALRVWPVVVLLTIMASLKLLPLIIETESMVVLVASILGPMLAGVLVLLWWITFSRANGTERLVGLLGAMAAAVLVYLMIDPTMQGPGMILIGIPLGTAAFGVAAILLRNNLSFNRTILAVLASLVGFGFTTTLRNDGMWGHGQLDLDWRWNESPEEAMLAARESTPESAIPNVDEQQLETWLSNPEWPQFRGPEGDGRYPGENISSNWTTPPQLIWKTAVGPGWSSFVVSGNLLFTQEQHGEQESVVCYSADEGKEIWKQQINQRFFDPLGGPGPRATPTLANGMLFAQSALGDLQRLDPKTGEVVWSVDIKQVAGSELLTWGFSSSPLVVGDNVVVYAGGDGDKGVLAFNVNSGELNWSAKAGNHSYSSPQLETVDGRKCILILSNDGLNMIDPDTGAALLDYEWKHSSYRATQAHVIDGASILIPTQELGTRRIKVTSSETGFTAAEEWTSRRLKPDFNDFVIFENHAYGFDGRIFICIDLDTGERTWKGGRYGKGQVLLLADSGLLLVASENGEVVLIKADPAKRNEVAKFQALEGRTWNHPVVIGDRLYVRNSQEAACFLLPTSQ